MTTEQKQVFEISTSASLNILYEWELHTCKRGHTWRFPKQTGNIRSDPVCFSWTDAEGKSVTAGTGAICLQCVCQDLVTAYGPVKSVVVP